jgi:biotin carboxyl carrier protein
MPGMIVGLNVSGGEAVKSGDVVAILEAMKMQNEIRSPIAAIVAAVPAREGRKVSSGDTLVELRTS